MLLQGGGGSMASDLYPGGVGMPLPGLGGMSDGGMQGALPFPGGMMARPRGRGPPAPRPQQVSEAADCKTGVASRGVVSGWDCARSRVWACAAATGTVKGTLARMRALWP